MDKVRRILYIENDEALVESFKEVVTERAKGGIQLTVAYHMDQAKNIIEKEAAFDGYIIDIMLPRDQEDWKKLEEAEDRRMKLLDDLIESTDLELQKLKPEAFKLRKEIDEVDEEIGRLVDEEGGVRLVELIAKRHCAKEPPEALGVPVIFWTARAAPELQAKCRQYVGDEYFKWMEKPTGEEEVLDEMVRPLALDGGT